MSEATEGLTGIDALETEMRDRLAAKNSELAQALFETEAQRQELAICNDQIAKMAAQIEELQLAKTRLEAELILMTAERDGALSMMQSVQADSIMAGKEIDFFRQDRDRWEKRFDSLLQIKVEAQMMQALQPMPNPVLDPLLGSMSEEQKRVLNGLLDKAHAEGRSAGKITNTEGGVRIEPVELINHALPENYRAMLEAEERSRHQPPREVPLKQPHNSRAVCAYPNCTCASNECAANPIGPF